VHLVAIGGSDAGISAALRARERDPSTEVTVVVADSYPNFSICGIPYYVSGEIPHWRDLAHRTSADLEAAGLTLRLDTTATGIDVASRRLAVRGADGRVETIGYDALVVGTGAVSVRPPITGLTGPDALGPDDGVHLLHSMGDTFAVMKTITETAPRTAVVVGAGYIGLEMAEGLTARGLAVTQIEALPEVLPTVDPELGALVQAELLGHGVDVLTWTTVQQIARASGGRSRLTVHATGPDGMAVTRSADLVLVVVGVRPDTGLAAAAGARLGFKGAVVVDDGMRTNLPGVFAAGDCVVTHHRLLGRTWLPLGTTAHKQGRVAGENALGGNRRFAGSLGTQVVKVFDVVAARTGLREHEALAAGRGWTPVTSAATPDDHKAYYPGATPIDVRVTGDDSTGLLLGAQLVGRRGAEISKRVDTLRRRPVQPDDRRPGQRPGPLLHPAAGLAVGRRSDGHPDLGSRPPAPRPARRPRHRTGPRRRIPMTASSPTTQRPTVLFVCVKNDGKSQMAAGLMNRAAGDTVTVTSAGTQPGSAVNGLSAQSLQELGIDITGEVPRALTPEMVAAATIVVTLGRGATVDPVPGPRFETWDTDEPSERGIDGIERMRLIRDDIARHVDELAARITGADHPTGG